MTHSFSKMDGIALAATVAQAFTTLHRVAYAQLSPDLTLAQVSDNFSEIMLLPAGVVVLERPLTELLWEFVGNEAALVAVLNGDTPRFILEGVNKQRANGTIVYLSYQVLPIISQRPEDGLLLIVEDTTQNGLLQQTLVQDRNELRLLQLKLTQANEALVQLNRLKSLFLSLAAHELRTPLTAIIGYADLLLTDLNADWDPNQHEYLEVIRAQANRLNRLINDLLNLDQIEQGKLSIQPNLCNLNEIVAEVIDVLKVDAQKRGITLTKFVPEVPLRLWVDEEKVRQILYNLIGNAIKYSFSGGRVQIVLEQSEETAVLSVVDSGLGMSSEQIANLFQPYYRTEEAEMSSIKGTGLGLYIVKALVEAHNGRIVVTSEPKIGSTFVVYLPNQPDK